MTTLQISVTIIVIAIGTLITRFLPFIVFQKSDKLPKFINYLAAVLPYAVIGILVIYCLKDIDYTNISTVLSTAVSLVFIALLHTWKRNVLLSILGGTLCYMILLQIV